MDEKGSRLSVTEQCAVLRAFSKALDREAHVLAKRPDLLWQQLYNRLQWEDEPVEALVASEREQRCNPGSKLWIRARTPFRESETLVRTLSGHTKEVFAAAFSPDSTRIVSASSDKTLKVWDAVSGQQLRTLEGHTAWVLGCAFSPDGSLIFSVSADKTLRIWEAASGHEPITIPLGSEFASELYSISLHRWQPKVICGGKAGELYILERKDVPYGPIMVTAILRKRWLRHALSFRCPACQQEHPLKQEQLGSELTCPTAGCGLRMRLNPFTIQPPSKTMSPLGWSKK
jgi:hypothetical protein